MKPLIKYWCKLIQYWCKYIHNQHNFSKQTNISWTAWAMVWMVWQSFKTYTGFKGYRLGDAVNFIKQNFPNSIAFFYQNKTKKVRDYSVLLSIINQKSIELSPLIQSMQLNQTLVIHLRLGDVLSLHGAEEMSIKDIMQRGE